MSDMMRIGHLILAYFEIIDLLPSGGQADLAKAVDRRSGRHVVIKKLLASPATSSYAIELARFERAGRIHINHPCVVNPLSYHQDGDEHYIVFPYIDGLDIDALIVKHRGRVPVALSVDIIAQLCDALAAAHAARIVHRDIKPQNILLNQDRNVRLIDFGVCRVISEHTIANRPGMLGTLLWMAPEQLDTPWQAGTAADLYGAGAVLYYLLTGQPPLKAQDTVAGASAVRSVRPKSPDEVVAGIPAPLSALCMRLLEKDPAARLPSASDTKKALEQVRHPGAGLPCCVSCGSRLTTGSVFCSRCGAPQSAPTCTLARCIACGARSGDLQRCAGCGRPFSPTDHRIRFSAGPLKGIEFRIPEGIYDVGRSQLLPHDHCLSRHQFSIACLNGTVVVQDANSTNSTLVRGQRAANPLTITLKDEIRIGNYLAQYFCTERRAQ